MPWLETLSLTLHKVVEIVEAVLPALRAIDNVVRVVAGDQAGPGGANPLLLPAGQALVPASRALALPVSPRDFPKIISLLTLITQAPPVRPTSSRTQRNE